MDLFKNEYYDFLENKVTILHFAAYFNSIDIFKYLVIDIKLSISSKSVSSRIPIQYTCFNGSTDVALYILENDPEQSKFQHENNDFPSLLYMPLSHNKIFDALIEKAAKNSVSKNEYNRIIKKAIGLYNIPLLLNVLKHFHVYLSDELNMKTFSMQAIINRNIYEFKILYMGKEELLHYYYDSEGFNSLVRLFCRFNSLQYKLTFLNILKDAKDIKIEPPIIENNE